MKYSRNKNSEKVIIQTVKDFLGKIERSESSNKFHVSELINPRKALFRRIIPKEITDAEACYFIAGRAHHEIVQEAFKLLSGPKTIIDIEHISSMSLDDKYSVEGTIDILIGVVPVEFKTSRKWAIENSPPVDYVKQVKCYCTILNQNKCKVVIFYITPQRSFKGDKSTTPEFVVWDIEFTDDELADCKKEMEERAVLLGKAIKSGNHKKLPLCSDWMCGSKGVARCPWYEECKPEGRYPINKLK